MHCVIGGSNGPAGDVVSSDGGAEIDGRGDEFEYDNIVSDDDDVDDEYGAREDGDGASATGSDVGNNADGSVEGNAEGSTKDLGGDDTRGTEEVPLVSSLALRDDSCSQLFETAFESSSTLTASFVSSVSQKLSPIFSESAGASKSCWFSVTFETGAFFLESSGASV